MGKYIVLNLELIDSEPLIWREFQVRKDLTLHELHLVIQGMFSWYNLGGFIFVKTEDHSAGQGFVRYYDDYAIESGEAEGPSHQVVTVAEVFQNTSADLYYTYGYEAEWPFKISYKGSVTQKKFTEPATCLAGANQMPPDNSGGVKDAAGLAEILDDPTFFDVAETNSHINAWILAPVGLGPMYLVRSGDRKEYNALNRFPMFTALFVSRSVKPDAKEEVLQRLTKMQNMQVDESADSFDESDYTVVLNLLELVYPKIMLEQGKFIPLLESVKAHAAMGLGGHEEGGQINLGWVYEWQLTMTKLGLLRKAKGELFVTKKGVEVMRDPQKIRQVIAERVLPSDKMRIDDQITYEITGLFLLYLATSDGKFDYDEFADLVFRCGWHYDDGTKIDGYDLLETVEWMLLIFWLIGSQQVKATYPTGLSDEAVFLARAALMSMKPLPLNFER